MAIIIFSVIVCYYFSPDGSTHSKKPLYCNIFKMCTFDVLTFTNSFVLLVSAARSIYCTFDLTLVHTYFSTYKLYIHIVKHLHRAVLWYIKVNLFHQKIPLTFEMCLISTTYFSDKPLPLFQQNMMLSYKLLLLKNIPAFFCCFQTPLNWIVQKNVLLSPCL